MLQYTSLWTCSMTVVCVFFRGPVNEDVFAAPAFHGGKIVDSDIQEISEQIHRLLLQVWAHTLDSGIKYTFSYQHLSVSVTIFSVFSRSTTWAPAVMAATAAMVPMSSWWASARLARATGTQGRQQRRQARPSLPGRSRRFVKGSTCWRTTTPRSAYAPHPFRPHHHHPSLSIRRPPTVSSV